MIWRRNIQYLHILLLLRASEIYWKCKPTFELVIIKYFKLFKCERADRMYAVYIQLLGQMELYENKLSDVKTNKKKF